MGDSAGQTISITVTVSITYLAAESVVDVYIAGITGLVALIVGLGALVVYVMKHPIPSFRGWMAFLAGGLTLLLAPFLFVYVVLGGHTTVSSNNMSGAQNILAFLSFFWLILDIFWVGRLYRRIASEHL